MSKTTNRLGGDELDDDCDCLCHHGGSHEYRLMRGSSIEGISIREVTLDKDGRIVDWSLPISPLNASVDEAREELEVTIKELTDVRKAFNRPLLDEADLESGVEIS